MAPNTYLTLGGYTFSDFGVPERINGGGAQKLVVHKLIGGTRVIDAMGDDDDIIRWRGRLRASGAMDNVATLDAMRRAGMPVTLTYWNQSALVVISKFTWEFERFFEVPYEIECTVVSNAAQAAAAAAATPDSAVGGDISLASSTAGGSAAVNAAIAPMGTAYSTYGPISSATATGQATISSTVNGVTVNLGPIAAAADQPAMTPGGIVAGGDPAAMAASLQTQAQVMTDGAAAQNTLPVVQRINDNISAEGGVRG